MKVTLVKDEVPQPPPTPKGEQPGKKQTVPSGPSAGGADKNENGKKRKLN